MTNIQKKMMMKVINKWRDLGEKERSRLLWQNDRSLYDDRSEAEKPILGDFPIRRKG